MMETTRKLVRRNCSFISICCCYRPSLDDKNQCTPQPNLAGFVIFRPRITLVCSIGIIILGLYFVRWVVFFWAESALGQSQKGKPFEDATKSSRTKKHKKTTPTPATSRFRRRRRRSARGIQTHAKCATENAKSGQTFHPFHSVTNRWSEYTHTLTQNEQLFSFDGTSPSWSEHP